MNLLTVEGLTKTFGEKKVFENKMYQFWIDNKFDDVYYNVKIEKGSIELELGKDEIRNLTFNDIVQVLSELLDASKLHFEKKGNQSIIICFNVDHKISNTFKTKDWSPNPSKLVAGLTLLAALPLSMICTK